jgi:23S rRNA (guanosine2251-2'-O)-methyltransferase
VINFLYGYHPVREALRHRPQDVVRVLVSAARSGKRREEVEELCRRHHVVFEVVPDRILSERAGPAHNGMAAEVREAKAASSKAGDLELIVLLEDVQDPRNLGALLRVCEGAGVGRVLIRDRGSAPVSPTVAKTSAGASEWLEIERISNTAMEVERLKEDGYWIYGTDAGGEPPWDIDLKGQVVLCFGGEEKGLRARTRQICDRMIGLPMRGRVGSLNIATAAAAVLYEAVRQRSRA